VITGHGAGLPTGQGNAASTWRLIIEPVCEYRQPEIATPKIHINIGTNAGPDGAVLTQGGATSHRHKAMPQGLNQFRSPEESLATSQLTLNRAS
jgi:hypothetical protein